MFWYFMKLVIMLPLVGGMAYGALWLWRKYQPGLLGAQGDDFAHLSFGYL